MKVFETNAPERITDVPPHSITMAFGCFQLIRTGLNANNCTKPRAKGKEITPTVVAATVRSHANCSISYFFPFFFFDFTVRTLYVALHKRYDKMGSGSDSRCSILYILQYYTLRVGLHKANNRFTQQQLRRAGCSCLRFAKYSCY